MSADTPERPTAQRGPRPRIGHKNRGCMVGCGVLLLGGIAGTIIAAYGMFFAMNRAVEAYLSPQRRPFTAVQLAPQAVADARGRAKAFIAAMEKQETPPALLLSDAEVNALLADFAADHGFEIPARVSFAGDKIHAELSVPLRGMYLNGSGELDIGLSNGVLQIFINQLEINGKAPPKTLMELARQHNLAGPVLDDPEVRRLLGELQYVTITNGKLKITPRAAGEVQGENTDGH